MTAAKVASRIAQCVTLFAFTYAGKTGDVDPFNKDLFTLTYDGDSMDVYSIDEVMKTPFFNGKSLSEIADKIKITEW